MATQRVFLDRTTGGNWKLTIEDGQMKWESTTDASESEPIIRDRTNLSNYWKVFLDDGQVAWESTATEQNESVDLSDTVTSTMYRLFIDDGQIGWDPDVTFASWLVIFARRRRRR